MTYGEKLTAAGISTGILAQNEVESILKSKIFLPSGSQILDIGCHGGKFSIFLSNIFAADVIGIDSSTSAIQLAEKNIKKTSTSGKVFFENISIENFKPVNQFDLIAHRGMEAFFKSSSDLPALIFSDLKNYGYVINLTHLYKQKPSEEFLQKLNKLLGMSISYISKEDLIAQYESNGLKLLYHEAFDIKRDTPEEVAHFFDVYKITENQQKDFLEYFKVIQENQDLVNANLFIFRKRDLSFDESIESEKA